MVDKWRTPWCYFCRHPPLPSPHQNNFRCRGNPICNKRVAAGVGSNFHSKVLDLLLYVFVQCLFLLDSWEFVWPDKRSHPTSSWRPFGPAWLRPSRPLGAQAVWPTNHCVSHRYIVHGCIAHGCHRIIHTLTIYDATNFVTHGRTNKASLVVGYTANLQKYTIKKYSVKIQCIKGLVWNNCDSPPTICRQLDVSVSKTISTKQCILVTITACILKTS